MTDKLEIAESTLFQAREKVLCDEIKSLRQQLSSYVKEDEIKANVNKLLVEQLAECQARENASHRSNYEKGVFNPVFDSPPEHTAEELK